MAEILWREAIPPDQLSLKQLTGLVRTLAGRPRFGLRQQQPVVVFELWLTKDTARWLIGADEQLGRHFFSDLAVQLPGLSLTLLQDSPRRLPTTAREVRASSAAFPLRLDTAGALSAGLLGIRNRLGADEVLVLQWGIGPSHTRTAPPSTFAPLEALGIMATPKPASGVQTAWKEKIAEPLYGVRGRVGAVAADVSARLPPTFTAPANSSGR
ncbi:hypothetical protein ACQPYE_07995 [Actinosynnema sp. CA-299493]